jgi:hypothetical protein
MVDLFGLIDLQLMSTVSASIGVLAGVTNWIIRTRRAERQRQTEIETRQAQLFMDVYKLYLDPDITDAYLEIITREFESYEEYMDKHFKTRGNIDFVLVGRYFSGVGVLLKRGLIDISLVYDLLRRQFMWTWEKYEPVLQGRRKAVNDPTVWSPIEYTYNELKKYEEQHPELIS